MVATVWLTPVSRLAYRPSERLSGVAAWTVEVYLRAYDGVEEARQSIGRFIAFYNARRPHAALDGRTPDQAYSHPLPLRTAA